MSPAPSAATDTLLRALGLSLELRGLEPRGYTDRMVKVALAFAKTLQLSEDDLRAVRRSVYVHDIGKLDLPASIAQQAGPLTASEWALVRVHTLISLDMIEPFDLRPQTLDAVRYHHECWDGSGYPDGLQGEAIPLLARVLAVVDSFMALTSHRHYRPARRHQDVISELAEERGKRLDPGLVERFLALLDASPADHRPDLNRRRARPAELGDVSPSTPQRVGARFAIIGAEGQSVYLSPALASLVSAQQRGGTLPLTPQSREHFGRQLRECLHTKRSAHTLTLHFSAAHSAEPLPDELNASLYAVPQPNQQTLTEHALLWINEVRRSSPSQTRTEQIMHRVAGSLIPMLVLNASGTIVEANAIFLQQSGYERGEVIGKPRTLLDGPATSDASLAKLQEAFGRRQPLELALAQYRKGGEAIWVTLSLEPVFGEAGGLDYVVMALRDMSARQRTQLEDQRLVDLSQDIFAITDNEGRYLRVNSAYQRLLGYSNDDVLGRPFYDFVHPDDVSLSLSVKPSVVPQQYFLSFENRLIGKDRQSRWFSWKITSFPSEGRMYWIGRDVTEKRRTEGALVESEALLNLIYETADVGICLTNPEGYFVKVNPAYMRLYGWSLGELIGQHFTKVVPDAIRETASQMHDDFIAGTMRELPADWQVQRKDARVVDAYVTAGRFVDRQGRAHKVTTVTDISARKETERQLAALSSALDPLPQAVLVASADDLGVIYTNAAFARQSGYDAHSALTLGDLFEDFGGEDLGGEDFGGDRAPDDTPVTTLTLKPQQGAPQKKRWHVQRSGGDAKTAYWVFTESLDVP